MTTQSIRFDGQVAVVTGAGGGIGRAIALELAARGAQLLVNDYGGDTLGHADESANGRSTTADAVAQEIVAAGGRAISNGIAVGTAQAARAIIDATLNAFGRIDILVNNAGVALPGPITKFSDAEVENLFRINLLGPHALLRAAWPHMVAQGYGRILNITSNAALGIGNNAPYGASKAGLIGLTLDAALEGKADNIRVNAFMPTAFTRLIEQIPDPTFVAWMRDNFSATAIAQTAAYFLSSQCGITGHVYTSGGGRVSRLAFAEGTGFVDKHITAETLRDNIDPEGKFSDGALHAIAQAKPVIFKPDWLERVFAPEAVLQSVKDICHPEKTPA
jgi:NAD(P)-dependent dehydrogenase (short-subunit alcohol dehydrogenase family)